MTIKDKFASVEAAPGRLRLTAALAIALLAASPSLHAADTPGMRVFKDPETGMLRAPTAQEAKALEDKEASDNAGKSRTPAGSAARTTGEPARSSPPVMMRSNNGAVGARVGDQFMSYSVMKRNADGTSSMVCVTGDEAADALVKTPPSVATGSVKGHRHAH